MAVGQERERTRWHFFERKRLTDKKTKSLERIDPLQDFGIAKQRLKRGEEKTWSEENKRSQDPCNIFENF
jgi:hypothetical protein